MGAFFYKLASFLVNRCPLRFSYWMADRLGDIYCFFARYSRRVVRNNLIHVFRGKISEEQLNHYIRETFREFSKYLVDFFHSSSLNERNIDRFVSIENKHYLDDALKAGQGIITLTAHFSSWELGGITLALKGYPFNAVILNHKNKSVNRFFVKQRKNKGVRLIPLGIAIRRCFEVLRQGEILALLGDREFNNVAMGIKINFCGRETRNIIPIGAAKLALKTGAKIIPTFVVRCKNNRSKLIFNQPVNIVNTGNREKDVRKIMEDFFAVFEKFVRKYPSQWFIFTPIWEKTNMVSYRRQESAAS